MMISVEVGPEDMAFIDREVSSGAYDSRSILVRVALRMLRESLLVDAYGRAFAEWDESEEQIWSSSGHDSL